jgi:hypothetical protein
VGKGGLMDAVLGWNLVLSLPVILVIAWLAGCSGCHPGIEDRAALKPVEQLRLGGAVRSFGLGGGA